MQNPIVAVDGSWECPYRAVLVRLRLGLFWADASASATTGKLIAESGKKYFYLVVLLRTSAPWIWVTVSVLSSLYGPRHLAVACFTIRDRRAATSRRVAQGNATSGLCYISMLRSETEDSRLFFQFGRMYGCKKNRLGLCPRGPRLMPLNHTEIRLRIHDPQE